MYKNNIQFFGLPGAGKSTLVQALLQKFPDIYEKIPMFSKTRRLLYSIAFMFYFPRIGFNFLSFIVRNDLRLWKYLLHLASVFFANQMHTAIRRKKQTKILLIDEGMLQRFLSVAYRPITEVEAKRMIKFLDDLQAAVVIVEGGDFDRFVHQPDRIMSPRNKLGDAYFKKWSENLMQNFETLNSVLENNKNCIHINNSNKSDASDMGRMLHDKIKALG
jgi:GTPase SAR1 family protein